MAKAKEEVKLKSELGDNSDIPLLEEIPNAEFIAKPYISEYIVYTKNDEIQFYAGIGEGFSISFKIDENDYNYQSYLAWVEEGNEATEIAL